jgi:hypothetical protein
MVMNIEVSWKASNFSISEATTRFSTRRYLLQMSTRFPEMYESPPNCRLRKGDMKIPYWGHADIRRHGTQFRRPVYLVPGIFLWVCARWVRAYWKMCSMILRSNVRTLTLGVSGLWRFILSYGLWLRVDWYVGTDVSDETDASVAEECRIGSLEELVKPQQNTGISCLQSEDHILNGKNTSPVNYPNGYYIFHQV